jgi:hypothetical protein
MPDDAGSTPDDWPRFAACSAWASEQIRHVPPDDHKQLVHGQLTRGIELGLTLAVIGGLEWAQAALDDFTRYRREVWLKRDDDRGARLTLYEVAQAIIDHADVMIAEDGDGDEPEPAIP